MAWAIISLFYYFVFILIFFYGGSEQDGCDSAYSPVDPVFKYSSSLSNSWNLFILFHEFLVNKILVIRYIVNCGSSLHLGSRLLSQTPK